MTSPSDRFDAILIRVKSAARKKILYLPHAIRQMSRPDRMISAPEVRRVVMKGEVIEDYPNDARGHSCLIAGRGEGGRIVHVVCAPKANFLAIITAYLPDTKDWSPDLKIRRPS